MRQIIFLSTIVLLQACNQPDACKPEHCSKDNKNQSAIEISGKKGIAGNTVGQEISCKLTSPELQKRRETIIASLKNQIKEKKELEKGYAFRFEGSDKVIDELSEFIKSERACCRFFTFVLSVSGDGKEAWLNLTGPEGAKDMIIEELGL